MSIASSCNPIGKRKPTSSTSDGRPQHGHQPFDIAHFTNSEKTMISADLLRRLRNDLPMSVTIAALGREGPPSKISGGYLGRRHFCW